MLTLALHSPAISGERDFGCAVKIIANAQQGRAHYQFWPGKNRSDVVYISNLVDVHILAGWSRTDPGIRQGTSEPRDAS
jgi:sterol-4alpha-carboxylate 3-dehydrogenase (decarboxylating)